MKHSYLLSNIVLLFIFLILALPLIVSGCAYNNGNEVVTVTAAAKRLLDTRNQERVEQIISNAVYSEDQQEVLIAAKVAVDDLRLILTQYDITEVSILSLDVLDRALANAPELLARYIDAVDRVRAVKPLLDSERKQFSSAEWIIITRWWNDAKTVNAFITQRLEQAVNNDSEYAARQQFMRDALELLPIVIKIGATLVL